MLIQRSTDFTPFKAILEASYPDQSMYPVITDLIQQLWDRGDPDGYAQQMTTHPLPDTPSHAVLMQIAYGDFQVSQYAGAAEARTIGASACRAGARARAAPATATCCYGIPAIGRYPFAGSAIELWDSGPGRVQPPPGREHSADRRTRGQHRPARGSARARRWRRRRSRTSSSRTERSSTCAAARRATPRCSRPERGTAQARTALSPTGSARAAASARRPRYFGAIRSAPSSLIVSPLSIWFSTI